jgi:hypothetical protein
MILRAHQTYLRTFPAPLMVAPFVVVLCMLLVSQHLLTSLPVSLEVYSAVLALLVVREIMKPVAVCRQVFKGFLHRF